MEECRVFFEVFQQKFMIMAGILTFADEMNSTNRPTCLNI